MRAGGNGNNQWEWEGNKNKTRLNLGLGMGMGMKHREYKGIGLKKTFPLISTADRNTLQPREKGLYRINWPGIHFDSRTEVHHTVLQDVTVAASDSEAHAVEHAETGERSGLNVRYISTNFGPFVRSYVFVLIISLLLVKTLNFYRAACNAHAV